MAAHVDFLGSLFVVWGVLTTLIGFSTLALAFGAAALMRSVSRQGGGVQLAAGLTTAAFAVLGLIAVLWGAAHVLVGVRLRRRQHWSRLAGLMFATIDLLLLPYGTVLGAYALWALLSEGGKELFEPARPVSA
jgi:hypothetical protein